MPTAAITALIVVTVMGLLTFAAIIHAGAGEFGSVSRKAIWILVAAIPFVGFFFYFLIGTRQAQKREMPSIEADTPGGADKKNKNSE